MLAEILPLSGVRIGEKTLTLNDPKCRMEQLFGLPESSYLYRCSYFGGALRVSVGGCGRVERIAFPLGAFGELQPTLFGVQPFSEDAEALCALLREKGGEAFVSPDGRISRFPKLGIELRRETAPADVENMIRFFRETKKPMTAEDVAFESARANRWGFLEMAGEGAFDTEAVGTLIPTDL